MKYHIRSFISLLVLIWLVLLIPPTTVQSQDAPLEVDMQGGEYLHLIYRGNSTCPYSTDEETIEMVQIIKEKMEAVAVEYNLDIWYTGIAGNDLDPVEGFYHIKKTGPYHEIISGGRVFDLGNMEFIYGELEGPGVSPQIIFSRTSMGLESDGLAILEVTRNHQELSRFIALGEIKELYRKVNEKPAQEIGEVIGLR